jgi:xanthosine utilization system XapX-like protein
VLSDTLYLIGAFYFVAELIVGMTFLFWELDTPTLPIVLQVVLLGIYIIVLLSSVMANDSTQEALKQQSNESDNIRSMLAEAEDVCLMVKKDPSVYKVVMRCYDDIKASPLRSTPEVQDIENEITSSLVLMRGYASSGDMSAVVTTASQVRQLVARRNSRLKNIRNY